MDKDTQESLAQLQMYEQNIQQILMQRQALSNQSIEIESALRELENTKQAYKIVGNIMVLADAETLRKELGEKKELVELRLKNYEKQEEQIRQKAMDIKAKLMSAMKGGKDE